MKIKLLQCLFLALLGALLVSRVPAYYRDTATWSLPATQRRAYPGGRPQPGTGSTISLTPLMNTTRKVSSRTFAPPAERVRTEQSDLEILQALQNVQAFPFHFIVRGESRPIVLLWCAERENAGRGCGLWRGERRGAWPFPYSASQPFEVAPEGLPFCEGQWASSTLPACARIAEPS